MSEKDVRVFTGDDHTMKNKKQMAAVLLSAILGITAN